MVQIAVATDQLLFELSVVSGGKYVEARERKLMECGSLRVSNVTVDSADGDLLWRSDVARNGLAPILTRSNCPMNRMLQRENGYVRP